MEYVIIPLLLVGLFFSTVIWLLRVNQATLNFKEECELVSKIIKLVQTEEGRVDYFRYHVSNVSVWIRNRPYGDMAITLQDGTDIELSLWGAFRLRRAVDRARQNIVSKKITTIS